MGLKEAVGGPDMQAIELGLEVEPEPDTIHGVVIITDLIDSVASIIDDGAL